MQYYTYSEFLCHYNREYYLTCKYDLFMCHKTILFLYRLYLQNFTLYLLIYFTLTRSDIIANRIGIKTCLGLRDSLKYLGIGFCLKMYSN